MGESRAKGRLVKVLLTTISRSDDVIKLFSSIFLLSLLFFLLLLLLLLLFSFPFPCSFWLLGFCFSKLKSTISHPCFFVTKTESDYSSRFQDLCVFKKSRKSRRSREFESHVTRRSYDHEPRARGRRQRRGGNEKGGRKTTMTKRQRLPDETDSVKMI